MKLRFRTKLSYGIGGIADNAMYTLQITYFLFFLTTVAGVKPALAGLISALGSLWEALCGPVVGYMSDSIETRYGKRKPFILGAALPAALLTTLLFTKVSGSETFIFVYYLTIHLLFWQCFAHFFVPMLSWGSDLTKDYNERTKLRTYAYAGNQVGAACGKVLPILLSGFLLEQGLSQGQSWILIGLIIGLIAAFSLLYSGLTIKETDRPSFRAPAHRKRIFSLRKMASMFQAYILIFRLRPILFLIICGVGFLIGNTFFGAALVYNFHFLSQLTSMQSAFVLLLITIAGILLAPLLSRFASKTDKSKVFGLGLLTGGLLLVVVSPLHFRSFLGLCAICIMYSVANACYWQLMPSMIYDACEAEELASGSNHAGQVISMQALSESVAAAVGAQLLGLVLQAAGFDDFAPVQGPLTVRWIYYCTTLIPGLLFIGVALAGFSYPISRAGYQRILAALRDRKQGLSVDMKEFTDIYGKKLRGVHLPGPRKG